MVDNPTEKVVAIYKCISDLVKLRTKVVTDIEKQKYHLLLKDIPVTSKNIKKLNFLMKNNLTIVI